METLENDPFYQECIRQARLSPCQKKGVGAVIVWDGKIFHSERNRPIPELESLCAPTCIRFQIPSRTESMLGSCSHAEERLIWDFVKRGGSLLLNTSIYVAAVTAEKVPEERPFSEFTCLRCAVALYYSEISSVYVAHMGKRWVHQTAEEALISAKRYALGEKAV